MTIRMHHKPPSVIEADDVITTIEFAQNTIAGAINYGPGIFDDAAPVMLTMKTTGHVVGGAWEMDDPDPASPKFYEGLTEFLDAFTLLAGGESAQHVCLCIPLAHQVTLQMWSASGENGYVNLNPVEVPQLPGGKGVMVGPFHQHPPHVPDEDKDTDPVLGIINRIGKHLWGPAWTLLDDCDHPC